MMGETRRAAVKTWFDVNLMQVMLPVFTSSNYILADIISEEMGLRVSPAEVHEVALELGYKPLHRHRTCFAYNAKFRLSPKDETISISDWRNLPARHKPAILFAQAGVDGPVYIGVTTNIRSRMEMLDRHNPNNIYMRGVMAGAYAALHNLTATFEPHFLKTGWYEPAPEIISFIYQSGQVETEPNQNIHK